MTSARLTGAAVGTGVSVGGGSSAGCGGVGVSVGTAVAAGTSVGGTARVAVGWGVSVGAGVQVGSHVGAGPDVGGVAVGAKPNRSPQAATSPATAATAQPINVRRDMFLPIFFRSLSCNPLFTITSYLLKTTKPPRTQTFASPRLPAASTRQRAGPSAPAVPGVGVPESGTKPRKRGPASPGPTADASRTCT
jgi:hypothetical protein